MRLVYLHGLASGPSSGKAQWFAGKMREAGRELEVPALDEGQFENLTVSGQLRLLEQLLQGEQAALMGSSLGGYLAALYAARHPEVQKLVLLAPAFGFGRLYEASLGPERVATWQRDRVLPIFHYADNRERLVGFELLQDALAHEAEPVFHQPALIFHGLRDDVVPPAVSQKFAEGRPNVELRLLDSDHQLTDAVEVIWAGIRRFLLD